MSIWALSPDLPPISELASGSPIPSRPQGLTGGGSRPVAPGQVGKAKLKAAIEMTRDILGVPDDYRIGIVPASDTGAVEMAMWSMLGARGPTMVAWESFGAGWVTDVVKQLKLDATCRKTPRRVRRDRRSFARRFRHRRGLHLERHHLGRARAERRCDPADRAGLTICDATSAAFAQDLPWDKLDVVTFSWQKVLGGEAAHGMLILSPRAVERLESYTPAWPLPKIFRLTKGGKLIEGIFVGETINTPSMLASRITSMRSTGRGRRRPARA
jgi:phosphoserine aminotransferase